MDDFEEEKLKKNRKPISNYIRFRLNNHLNNFVGKLCAVMINAFQDIYSVHFAFINEIIKREDCLI